MRTQSVALIGTLILTTLVGPTAGATSLTLELEEYELENGLRVVLHQDQSSPMAAVSMTYDVGSRNEELGRSGFAHLFEHMMFQGSAHVGKAEHFQLISSLGGRMNGTTSEERTNYFQMLPANQLELMLWLESDRLRSLALNEENFENQRQTVKEERRLRVDNQPYVPTFLAITEEAFDAWEYSHSVIGSMDDLDAAVVEDAALFFARWYAPDNAVLTVSGNFERDEARGLIDRYFSDVPRGMPVPTTNIEEPPHDGPREVVLQDPLAPSPATIAGWISLPLGHADSAALTVAAHILSTGESSRFRRALIDTGLAVDADVGVDEHRGPSLWYAYAIAQGDAVAMEAALLSEVARLSEEPPSEAELEKVKTILRTQRLRELEDPMNMAYILGQFAVTHGTAAALTEELDAQLAVTAGEVQRAAATWLRHDLRVIARAVPAAASPEAAESTEGE